MMTFAHTILTPAQAFAEIARRRIGITSAFDGRVWVASVELKGDARHNRKRNLQTVSAIGSTPIAAVQELVAKLDGEPQSKVLFQEADAPW